MGIAERRAREKDDLRRKIIETATTMFLEEGYQNVSMRKIADRIEYAPSTIYLHFKDKADLVASICIEAFADLDRRLQATLDLGRPPLETLRLSLRDYLQFGLDHPGNYIFVLCTPEEAFAESHAESHRAIKECGMSSFSRLRNGIKACMDAGEIRQADLESVAQTCWLMIHGLTAGLVTLKGFPFIERQRLVDDFLDRLVLGLK